MREIIKTLLLLIFYVAGIAFPAFCGVGDVDNREYVSDAEWATEPYKNFVYLRYGIGDGVWWGCTAQYIAPNLILSAGHCVEKGATYEVRNYKRQTFKIKLLQTNYTNFNKDGDWAVFLVEDPQYYSDSFFNVEKVAYAGRDYADVLNAGWGKMRVLTNDDMKQIRGIIDSMPNALTADAFITRLKEEMDKRDMLSLIDFPERLKKSECKVVFIKDCGLLEINDPRIESVCNNQILLYNDRRFPNIIATTCDTWEGNSGGGYISFANKSSLYGVVSYGAKENKGFSDASNTNYMASAYQFLDKVNELKVKYPVQAISQSVDLEEPIASNQQVGENGVIANKIQDLSSEINQIGDDITRTIPTLSKRSDKEILPFLDKVVKYQVKSEQLKKLEANYKSIKENEQSLANRTLTAATTAATGIGGMELARGLAEQNADKKAEADMAAYIETFRCTYGNGQSVKVGPEPVELPGGNDATMMSLQNEYKTLAASLKERKESLGMKPGIESELILDKAEMGLYDQENVGITGGAYSSLYRATVLNSESDQSKINADKEASANRVKYGGIAAGAGAGVGVIGNSLINGKLGESLKGINLNDRSGLITGIKTGLSNLGLTNLDNINWSDVDTSSLQQFVQNADFENLNLDGYDASSFTGTDGFNKLKSMVGM